MQAYKRARFSLSTLRQTNARERAEQAWAAIQNGAFTYTDGLADAPVAKPDRRGREVVVVTRFANKRAELTQRIKLDGKGWAR